MPQVIGPVSSLARRTSHPRTFVRPEKGRSPTGVLLICSALTPIAPSSSRDAFHAKPMSHKPSSVRATSFAVMFHDGAGAGGNIGTDAAETSSDASCEIGRAHV